MPYTLGKPNCRKCKGVGVVPAEDRIVEAQDGRQIRYPQVARCSCLEVPIDEAPEKPDMQKRAAGETES
jgi:hypothetical protein